MQSTETLTPMTLARFTRIDWDRGIEIMAGEVLANGSEMLRLCEKLGFHTLRNANAPGVVTSRRPL